MAPYIQIIAREAKHRLSSFSQGPGMSPSSSDGDGDGHRLNHHYNPGQGSRPPQDFNNKAFFALFAILGAAMVVASLWFFFWAKNGGFIWKKTDWDDYKSTVLRRKGKDGKTLSNATPATDLGEKSIAGTFDIDGAYMQDEKNHGRDDHREKRRRESRPHTHRRREPSDEDLKAYRHEKPARVGGLNRQQDGSDFDFTSTEPSEVFSHNSAEHLRPKPEPPRKKGFLEKQRQRKQEKQMEKQMEKRIKLNEKIDKKVQANKAKAVNGAIKKQEQGRSRHVFAADETSTIADTSYMYSESSGSRQQDSSYFDSYRPPAPPHAPSRRHEAARQPSPPKRTRPPTSYQRYPGPMDAHSEAGSGDTGTKIYAHHIPSISRGSRDTGFRREAPRSGRRDSLSDSEDGEMGGWRR